MESTGRIPSYLGRMVELPEHGTTYLQTWQIPPRTTTQRRLAREPSCGCAFSPGHGEHRRYGPSIVVTGQPIGTRPCRPWNAKPRTLGERASYCSFSWPGWPRGVNSPYEQLRTASLVVRYCPCLTLQMVTRLVVPGPRFAPSGRGDGVDCIQASRGAQPKRRKSCHPYSMTKS
jgi:hypothetical protein